MRQIKESNNLSLLSKINKQRIASPKKRALISSSNNKLKLESKNSYFAMSNNAAKNKDESFNSHKPNKPNFNNFKEKFNGFKFTSMLDNSDLNEKAQHNAGVRRFMKKVVTRILKRIYLIFTTSRLPNAIEFRDFSEFNLSQIMDTKLPSETNKK
jgi:hypothetical protein